MTDMRQLDRDEALALHDSGIWRNWSDAEIAWFQFHQERLCIPFQVFSAAMSRCLGRSVYTHEFASSNREALAEELAGKRPAPDLAEIIAKLPAGKETIIVGI